MAETETLQREEQKEEESQESAPQQQETPRGSFLDPDVLIFALPVAITIDILDVVLAMGVIANLIVGSPLILWMVWKTGKIEAGREQIQRVQQGPQERAEFSQRQQERLAARRAATRRAWRRGILYFLGGLVPILSIFVLWTWAVISTVRGK